MTAAQTRRTQVFGWNAATATATSAVAQMIR